MKCRRCQKEFEQLEEHHLWPKFMDNKIGASFNEFPSRVNLCIACHKAINHEIIIPILNDFAGVLVYSRSGYWLWKRIANIDKPRLIKKVVEDSYNFIFDKSFEND